MPQDKVPGEEDALQLALSYREKARNLGSQRAAGAHLARANRIIEAIRAERRAQLAHIERELRRCGEEQLRLSQALSVGGIAPAAANEASRKIATEISELRHEASRARQWASVESTAAVGGFKDLPIDAYARAIPPSKAPFSTAERTLLIAVSLWMAIAVFLPWVSVADRSYSLLGLGALSPATLWRWAWAPYLVLPLITLAFVQGRDARGGWGAFGLGAFLMWLAGQPLVWGLPGVAGATSLHALSVVRPGLLLYGGGGALLLILGARRITARGFSLRETLPMAGAFVVLAAVIAVASLGLQQWASSVPAPVFTAALEGRGGATLALDCRNNGRNPLVLGFDETAEATASGSCLVHLEAQEAPDGPFLDVSALAPPWNAADGRLSSAAPIEVSPGARYRATLDLNALSAAGLKPLRVRLRVTQSGKDLWRFETDQPKPLIEASAAEPAPRQASRRYEDKTAAVPTPNAAPTEPAASAPGRKPAAPPPNATRVTIFAKVGDKLILSVNDARGRAEQIPAMIGDEVASRWEIVALETAPISVELRHRRTGERLTLTRDGELELREK